MEGRVVKVSVFVGESCICGPGCGNTMGNISSSEPETECQNSLTPFWLCRRQIRIASMGGCGWERASVRACVFVLHN